MKALFAIFIACIFFSTALFEGEHKMDKYCAALRDGVMVLLKDGMVVTTDVTINDSIKVTTDCVVIKKDGTRINLKDGECITSGNIEKKGIEKENSEK
jgi:hypothetical protein